MPEDQRSNTEPDLARAIARIWEARFADPYQSLFDSILREARELLGARAAVLNTTIDGTTMTAVAISGDAKELLGEHLAVEASNCGAVLETGAAMNLPQAWQDQRTWHPAASPARIGPTMVARVCAYPSWGAVIALYNPPGAPDWTDLHLALLDTYASAIGFVIRPLISAVRAASIERVDPAAHTEIHHTATRERLGRALARQALAAGLHRPAGAGSRLALDLALDEAVRDAAAHPDDPAVLHALVDTFWTFTTTIAAPTLRTALEMTPDAIATLAIESLDDPQ